LLQQAEQYRENVSGVNLDEEAANMLRYQQAYQASAQIIKIASDVFTTLINSLGR
jgi:flagellar hook-associated protein 1 FlgK